MPGIEKLNLRIRYVPSKSFRSRRNKERVVLAPDRKQRWFGLAKVFLEFRVELHVRRIVQKQIELNLFVPGPFEQGRVQCVRLWRNTFRIRYTLDVLPAGSTRRQNSFAKDVPILWRGCSPVLSDRTPSIAKAFFVCIPVLRNNC